MSWQLEHNIKVTGGLCVTLFLSAGLPTAVNLCRAVNSRSQTCRGGKGHSKLVII